MKYIFYSVLAICITVLLVMLITGIEGLKWLGDLISIVLFFSVVAYFIKCNYKDD